MLFKTHKPSSSQPTFAQQLSYLKNNSKVPNNMSKNSEYYKVMASILDLLLNKYPSMSSEILILKQSLKKWYGYLSEEANERNSEILKMKDDGLVNVSREIGTVLQQIGYYVKYLTQRYQDQDMKKLYAKYLSAIKKLQWNEGAFLARDMQTQTDLQEVILTTSHTIPTFRSIKMIHHPHSGSDLTLDSLPGSYKTIDQDRYVKVKQENLQLQRKMDRLQCRIKELQSENIQLKTEIDRLFLQNQQLNISKDKSLQQLNKLKQLLQQLKDKEQQDNKYEQTKRIQFEQAQNKYEHFNQIRAALHRNLQNAQQQIIESQSAKQINEPQQYLNSNFTVINEDKYKTIKKGHTVQQNDSNSQLRMMLVQALAIQSFLTDSSFYQP